MNTPQEIQNAIDHDLLNLLDTTTVAALADVVVKARAFAETTDRYPLEFRSIAAGLRWTELCAALEPFS